MSGSSSGGSSSGGGSGKIDCHSLDFFTQLSSPKESVVKKLVVGILLDVAPSQDSPDRSVIALYEGKVAGGIMGAPTGRLLQCMAEGVTFTAQVDSIDQGQVRVRVYAK